MKQRSHSILEATVKHYYPNLSLPVTVRHARAYFEGVIACHFAGGKMFNGELLRVDIPYKEGSEHYNDWMLGWDDAFYYGKELTLTDFLIESINEPDEVLV